LLVNVPHPAIGSRIPKEQLPPLGLLSIGGPLIDDGHEVRLIDGEFGPMPLENLVAQAVDYRPDTIPFGHSGSSSGHPVIGRYAAMMRRSLPGSKIVYGGVHPTYFWREMLAAEPWLDAIVRGEGEETVRRLIQAFVEEAPLDAIEGLAF